MSELDQLPGVDGLRKVLRRLEGFGFLLCVVPSRGAGEDARARVSALLKELGRVQGAVESLGSAGQVCVEVVFDGTPPARRARYARLNVARDQLGGQGRALLLLLLEGDLPMFAEAAPDLWSVRTEMVRHARPALRNPGAPLELRHDGALSAEVDRATRFVSLQGLQVGADGRRIPQAELDALYLELLAASPAGSETAVTRPREPAGELLTRYAVSMLVGPAGSGKSTVLRRLARSMAATGLPVALVSLAGANLRGLTVRDLEEALHSLLASCPWVVPPDQRPWLLLDGLDEVGSAEARAHLVQIADDLVWTDRVSGVVISLRPELLRPAGAAGEPDEASSESLTLGFFAERLAVIQLLPLGDQEIHTYLERWVHATLEPDQRGRNVEILERALGFSGERSQRTERLRELCRRPLFLAVVAALFWARGEEISGEAELLDAFVKALIHRGRARVGGEYSHEDMLDLARETAWVLHESRRYAMPVEAVSRASPLLDASTLSALRVGTGLLMDSAEEVRFIHAALQQVLVAQVLFDRAELEKLEGWLFSSYADAVSRLLAETASSKRPQRFAEFVRDHVSHVRSAGEQENRSVSTLLVASLLADVWGSRQPLHLRRLALPPLCASLLEICGRARLDLADPNPMYRLNASYFLGSLGDERIGGLAFVPIDEDWELARWPVTNKVFAPFVEAGNYRSPDESIWGSKGLKWLRSHHSRRKDAPERWGEPGFSNPNEPVCGLSYHEARAFVAWWQREHDRRVMLPSWELWRRVARGSVLWRQHIEEVRPRDLPYPVGAFLSEATPEGVEDLGGLVREWLSDEPEAYAGYAFCDPPVPLSESYRVRKGGGRRWYHPYGLRLARRRAP